MTDQELAAEVTCQLVGHDPVKQWPWICQRCGAGLSDAEPVP